jgi:hypothetical protein
MARPPTHKPAARFGIEQIHSSRLFEQASELAATSQHSSLTTPNADVATTVAQLVHLAPWLIELDPDLTVLSHRHALRSLERLRKTEAQYRLEHTVDLPL